MRRLSSVLFVSIFASVGWSVCVALEYLESSTGLLPPDFDGGPTEVEMGDVNDDGHVDLVSIGDHGSPWIGTDQHGVMVWFGDGTGVWSVSMNGNFGYGGVSLGDVNGDGHTDVGYGMHHDYSSDDFGDQLLEVALGDGSGQSWVPWDDGLGTNGETWGMSCTDFGDVDVDGDLDIVANSFGSGAGIHVYLNQGDGTWIQSFGFLGGNSGEDIVFGDVNNDGYLDFAAAHQYGTVYTGDGTGLFTLADGNLPPHGEWDHYRGPDLEDVDNDGGDDLSFCNTDGGVEVWVWDSLDTWNDFSGTLPSSGGYEATQLCDMNLDGEIDLVAFGSGQVTVWGGDAEGNWEEIASFTTPSPGSKAAFRVGGDVDHNGFPDIALVADEGSWPNDRNRFRVFREASVAESLTVSAVRPRGRESLRAGMETFVEWMSGVPEETPGYVHLELSTTGPAGPFVPIADSVPNNGSYQWRVPEGILSEDCYVRFTVVAEGDTCSGMTSTGFTIVSSTPLPNIGVEPLRLDAILNTGEIVTDTLVIRNYGSDTLDFRLEENAGTRDEIPWVSEDPDSGRVDPGSQTEISVTFNASGLSGGVYSGELVVSSNDPDEPEIAVELTLSVNPPGAFALLLPESGDTVESPVSLEWQEAVDPDPDDTVRYDLWMAHQSDFRDSTVVESLLQPGYEAGGLLADTHYYWKVRAYDRWGIERWADSFFSFRTLGGPAFLRADANSDMEIEMSDAILTLKYLYLPGSPEATCRDAADSDDDGEILMSDATYTLKYLYIPESPRPPEPFPTCGPDETPDQLDCGPHPCQE